MKTYALLSDSELLRHAACSTLFDYLVRELKYSETQAADRVNAVRLMRAVPEVKKHLSSGQLSLTTASQIQRHIRAEVKAVQELKIGRPSQAVSVQRKQELISLCLGQPKRGVEKILFQEASIQGKTIIQERLARVNECRTELKFTISDQALHRLEQLKNLIGNRSLESIFNQSIELLLKQEAKKRGALQIIQASEDQNTSRSKNVPVQAREEQSVLL